VSDTCWRYERGKKRQVGEKDAQTRFGRVVIQVCWFLRVSEYRSVANYACDENETAYKQEDSEEDPARRRDEGDGDEHGEEGGRNGDGESDGGVAFV
jgi:hypothetical protein